jgi:EAL domain-containing protein (putative c-di-GMP-specific phosphodiesterase class I)
MEKIKDLSISYFTDSFLQKDKRMNASFEGFTLGTALQPVYSLAHKRIVGYEALLRAEDRHDNSVSPAGLFSSSSAKIQDIITLDRLSRYLHMHNFTLMNDDISWLFLNVSPQTIKNGRHYGPFFRELLEKYNFPAHRIVIEVVEYPIEDNMQLVEIVNFYKNMGCLIAIDDFGAGYSNFDRIWTLKPDIVKLDRSFLVKASNDTSVENMLGGIVSLLHQSGSFVLIEGIETKSQALTAIECNADFVQGYYFGKPRTDFYDGIRKFDDFDGLFQDYKNRSDFQDKKNKASVEKFNAFFSETISLLKKGESLSRACRTLLRQKSVVRCYLVDQKGVQTGDTVVSEKYEYKFDLRFRPLDNSNSADWFRRHYLKRALIHPGQLQITRPYLSITGAHMCMTLSMMFYNEKSGNMILCCDISV